MDQWFFSADEIKQLPSVVKGGMSANEECQRRFQGCTFIEYLGCRLGRPQQAVATAMVYFHRFYARHSFSVYKPEILAATCIFVACKAEEAHLKINLVVNTSLAHLDDWKDDNEQEARRFFAWRDAIVRYELILLETLCFDLSISHPYQPLLDLLDELQAPESIVQSAWGFVNDSLRLPLCLTYEPRLIAAACVLLSCRLRRQQLPENKDLQLMQLVSKRSESLQAIIQEIMLGYTIQQRLVRQNARPARPPTSSDRPRNSGPACSRDRPQIHNLSERPAPRAVESQKGISRIRASALSS